MPEGLPLIPASAWNNVPWQVTVSCFVLVVLTWLFATPIRRYLGGRSDGAVHVAGDINRQALELVNGVSADLVAERAARIAARRDADRGWWLARHWNGVSWYLLSKLRETTTLVFSTRMALLMAIERYNTLQPDPVKRMGVPEWAVVEDGRMRPTELKREDDLVAFEAPQPPATPAKETDPAPG